MEYKITNFSCSANLNTKLNLKFLKTFLKGSISKYPRFHGLIYNLEFPKCTIIFYSTGKILIVGIKEFKDAFLAGEIIEFTLKEIKEYKKCKFSGLKINNIAVTLKLPHQIFLNQFILEYRNQIQYEPELFPGIFFRPSNIKITSIIFHQGKIIITGFKKESDIDFAVKEIYKILNKFKK